MHRADSLQVGENVIPVASKSGTAGSRNVVHQTLTGARESD